MLYFYSVKRVFHASPFVIYIFDLLRVPLKNSFDAYFEHFIDDNVDEVIDEEQNLLDIIHALQGKLFLSFNRIKERSGSRYS